MQNKNGGEKIMIRCIKIVGVIGFFICLAIMYITPYGVRGLKEYDSTFEMPDMKFHYRVEQITQELEKVGTDGRNLYQKYLVLDCIFVFCFGILMLTITDSLFTGWPSILLYVVCMLRGFFDILENCLLIIVLKNFASSNTHLLRLCSYFTTCKFIMLYIWVAAIAIHFTLIGIAKLRHTSIQ